MYNPQIETFIVVADAGSFNKAAEVLYVSSTAVIKQMNLLEERIGVRLFNRSYKGLSLTKAGQLFYENAKHIIAYSEEAIKVMKETERGISDIVRIGSSPMTPIDYISDISPALQEKQIQFQIVPFENNPENARQILDNLGKDIDIVLGVYDEQTPAYYQKVQRLTVEHLPVGILMGNTHELSAKEQLTWADLEGRRVYLLDAKWSSTFTAIRNDININHPSIEVIDFPFLNTAAFNNCLRDNDLFIGVEVWEGVHPFLTMRPMDWDYEIQFGFIYGQNLSAAVKNLLEVVNEHSDS